MGFKKTGDVKVIGRPKGIDELSKPEKSSKPSQDDGKSNDNKSKSKKQ